MKPLIIIPVIENYVKWTGTLESWEWWCNKNNIQLHIQKGPYTDNRIEMWTDKWDAIKIIKDKYPDTTHVGMIDADVMVRWDAPNMFEYVKEDKLYAIRDSGNYSGLDFMLNKWKPLYPNSKANASNYFNAGVLFMGVSLLEEITPQIWWAYENQFKIDNSYNKTDEQTPLNHLIGDKLSLLPREMNDMVMFNYDDFEFINNSYLWHFTGPKMGGWSNKGNLINECWEIVNSFYN